MMRTPRSAALLVLLMAAAAARAQPVQMQIIFDASGSMEKETERSYSRELKVRIARDELRAFVSRLPRRPDFQVALRVFGTVRERRCEDTPLLRPFAPVDDGLLTLIDGITPAPFGKTPIARSLDRALDDFKALPTGTGSHSVLLITDGVETCDGNVDASISKIYESGITLKVHIVGFDVLDFEDPAQKKLENVARATGGEVLYPKNREELQQDLQAVAKKEAPAPPAAAPATAPSRGLLGRLRDNLILVVIVAAVVVLGGAVLLLRGGARRDEDE